ncbi:MAG: M20/M25/M40 family metallo-hydrolase [Acholeplasmataceae bacterium]
MWWIYLLIIIVLLIIILIIKTLIFKKTLEMHELSNIDINNEKAIESLAKKLKIPTISYRDSTKINQQAFHDFKALLINDYPHIQKHATYKDIGTGILFHIQGQSKENPIVLMAHFDVVPVSNNWSKDPFGAETDVTYLYGRGTLDTKVTVNAIMESVEYLLSKDKTFKQDLYIAFSGEEEINGPTQKMMVSYFKEHHIKPYIVFDEGGAIVSNMFPGVKEKVAVIGIAEKGFVNIELKAKSKGGHASTPPKDTPVTLLSKAVVKINQSKAFKMKLTSPIKTMFNHIACYSRSFPIRMIFANTWLFTPIIKLIAKLSGGELYAMFKTTLAFTVTNGSSAINVLPNEATFGINIRIRPGETSKDIVDKIKKIVRKEHIEVHVIDVSESTTISLIDDGFKLFDKAIKQTWDKTIVSPYLMVATTDSRHYHEICERVYKFAPYQVTSADLKLIHGDDEKISKVNIVNAIKFYINFLNQL